MTITNEQLEQTVADCDPKKNAMGWEPIAKDTLWQLCSELLKLRSLQYVAPVESEEVKTEDGKYFGVDAWVYCRSHMAPHRANWCTVGLDHKVRLFAENYEDAVKQCKVLELPLFRSHPISNSEGKS